MPASTTPILNFQSPHWEYTEQHTLLGHIVELGDGYTQTCEGGINASEVMITLTSSVTEATKNSLDAEFKLYGGQTMFRWRDQTNEPYKYYRCLNWGSVKKGVSGVGKVWEYTINLQRI